MTKGLQEFVELLEVIADNKYVLGDRLVEVGISGPDLEATLSAIAMAQGELGHARILYYWAHDLKGNEGKKPEIKEQTGKAFKGVTEIHNWITLIASLYTVNLALDIVLRAVFAAGHSDVVTRIHKLIREQKEHIMYSRGWARQLMNDQGAVPRKFNEALDRIIPEVEGWLKTVDEASEIVKEGFLPAGANLAKQFEEEIAKLRANGVVANAV